MSNQLSLFDEPEYKYLSIDKDGRAHELTVEPFDNGFRWFAPDLFSSDTSMRPIKEYDERNYEKVFKF